MREGEEGKGPRVECKGRDAINESDRKRVI